ncbi:MAG: polysaccharide pyruvyl transferase family protein [Anderseniella sp.]|nr:polysaccharide pyruvyl transferase family protein [Anderseniella sp.]
MYEEWVDASTLDPSHYSHVFFICGPFTKRMMEKRWTLLKRFAHCTFVGVNLSMIADLDDYNPFEVLIERDGSHCVRPDLSFLQIEPRVPVVGLCLVESQREYGSRQRHSQATALLHDLILRSGVAAIEVDTRLGPNPEKMPDHGFRSPSQFESAVARFDVVLTTRLHGMVLALKNGVPVIAIDAVSGGDKVSRQAREICWPEVFDVDMVTSQDLDHALERCLLPDASERAQACADRAKKFWEGFEGAFLSAMEVSPNPALRSSLSFRPGLLKRLRTRLI